MYVTHVQLVNTCIHTRRFSDYELVRIYHPDSPVLQALNEPPDFSRFHAITVAYDALRGKSSSPRPADSDVSLGRNSEAAMVKARMAERARRAEFLETGKDERWKEWIFMGAILLVWSLSFSLNHLHAHIAITREQTAVAFVAQTFWTRRKALVHARSCQPFQHPNPDINDAD
jgi:hypothetical protein